MTGTIPSFDIQVGKKQYSVMSEDLENLEILRQKFKACSELPYPTRYSVGCRVCYGCGYILTIPNKITNGFLVSMEKIGERVKDTPDWVFRSPSRMKKKRFVPGNIATGLAVGTGSMISGVVSGLAGLVTEPYKGLKTSGLKGATIGLGKGLLGLLCKPVAGTLDFLSYSVRGIKNMPKSMYRGVVRIYKKNRERKK